MKNVNWTRILTILLVVLASYAILYITGTVLVRFRHALFIFVMGAIVAYLLAPVVNRLESVVRVRWIAILIAYLSLASLLLALGYLLFTPFILQSQSLIDNLHNPSTGSLETVTRVECLARQVNRDLRDSGGISTCGGALYQPGTHGATAADLARLQKAVVDLKSGTIFARRGTRHPLVKSGRQPPNPEPQTQVPPSYVSPIDVQVQEIGTSLQMATNASANFDPAGAALALRQAVNHAHRAQALAAQMYDIMRTTPILIIRAQTWLDGTPFKIDLHSKFGDASRQLSNQGTTILGNAVTIAQETANALLNTTLICIVAFYMLSDGRRIVHGTLNVVPMRYREQVWYFVTSLDRVLGGYIRGQLFLSALAGILGGAGAAALGVPYPLLIGILTFLLESIPVVGALIALVPAVAVSLFFMPIYITVLLLAWNMVFQQLVTNVLGPRIMGIAVGIHPLEAMAAVLLGYPIAGFVGAFLAVPVAGILHVVVREFYGYAVHGRSLPTAVPVPPEGMADEAQPGIGSGPNPRTAPT